MNGLLTAAVPMFCCGITFTALGMSLRDATFLSLGLGFLAAGIPFSVIGFVRKRAAKE